MKNIMRKSIIRKIAIILLVVMCVNTVFPVKVQARSFLETVGGVILKDILNFLMFVGDALLNILQKQFISNQDVVIEASSGELASSGSLGSWLKVILGVIVVIVSIVVAIASWGTLSWASFSGIMAGIQLVGGVLIASSVGVASAVVGSKQLIRDFKGSFDLPMIRYTPYEIFSNQIPLLDVNFINPMKKIEEANGLASIDKILSIVSGKTPVYTNSKETTILEGIPNERDILDSCYSYIQSDEWINEIKNCEYYTEYENSEEVSMDKSNAINEDVWQYESYVPARLYENEDDSGILFITRAYTWQQGSANMDPGETPTPTPTPSEPTEEPIEEPRPSQESYMNMKIYFNVYCLTKEEVLNIGNNITYESSAAILQKSISTWYKAVRVVAIVVLLSMLVFVGIKMILTSVSEEKAKYKKFFIDWLTAICLLFILHYIMIFILEITQSLTNVFLDKNGEPNIMVELPEDTKIKDGEALLPGGPIKMIDENTPATEIVDGVEKVIVKPGGLTNPVWSCSFTGYIRLRAGMCKNDTFDLESLSYSIIYLALVVYTFMFTFIYIRRVLTMAFLTMIAPLIAVTYPLDKIKDGRAQAYEIWIKEYTFNALIQPVHLIIYILTVSNVMNTIKDHPMFALIAMGFLLPAEKFIRKMFGFDRAETLNALGKAAGGAAIMSGVKQLSSLGKRHTSNEEKEDKGKVRTADNDKNDLNIPNISETGGNSAPQVNNGANQGTGTNSQNSGEGSSGDSGEGSSGPNSRSGGIELGSDTQNGEIANQGSRARTQSGGGNSTEGSKNSGSGRGFISRVNSGLINVGSSYRKKALKAKPLRFLGKLTGKAIGATTLGMVGLAAGITTGNVKDVLTFTTGAASVGSTIGGNISENIMDEMHGTKETFAKGYLGEEEYNNRKLDREFVENESIMKYANNEDLHPEMRGNIIRETRRIRMLQEEVQVYRQAGITDDKQIVSMMKMGLKPVEGVYAIQLASRISKKNWNKQSVREDYLTKFRNALHEKGVGNDQIDRIFEGIPKILFKA